MQKRKDLYLKKKTQVFSSGDSKDAKPNVFIRQDSQFRSADIDSSKNEVFKTEVPGQEPELVQDRRPSIISEPPEDDLVAKKLKQLQQYHTISDVQDDGALVLKPQALGMQKPAKKPSVQIERRKRPDPGRYTFSNLQTIEQNISQEKQKIMRDYQANVNKVLVGAQDLKKKVEDPRKLKQQIQELKSVLNEMETDIDIHDPLQQ